MTLDTKFIIRDPVIPPREVFDVCRGLIGATDAHTWQTTGTHSENPGWHNNIAQGLPALLYVWYGADGPLFHSDCYCDELRGDGKCGPCNKPSGFVEVSFDTGYGYRGPNGEGCGDLHAALVDRLGAWCDARGLRWSWQNEFTGEWHDGREGLSELGDGGLAASDWFRSTVLPAIASSIVGGTP